MEKLAEQPGKGRARPDIAEDYHSYVCASHTIYYQKYAQSVVIIGILHQRMDAPSRLDR